MSIVKPDRMSEANFDCTGETHYGHRSKDPGRSTLRWTDVILVFLDILERIERVL
jgi:hypothetical protein